MFLADAAASFAPTRFEFNDDWRSEVEEYDATVNAAPTHAHAATTRRVAQPTPPAVRQTAKPRPPSSANRTPRRPADQPHEPHTVQTPPSSGPSSGGRGGRAKFVGHGESAPIGSTFERAYAHNRSADTSQAPTYSEEHGMNLYNPNEISWAGGIPPLDTVGLQLHEASPSHRRTEQNEEAAYTQREMQQLQQPQQRPSRPVSRMSQYTNYPVSNDTNLISPSSSSRPESREVSRPSSRAGVYPGVPLPLSHPAYSSISLGSAYETIFASSAPADTSIAPTWSDEHGMHLYNPNEISWPGGVPPPGRTGLKLRSQTPQRQIHSPPTHDPPSSSEAHADDEDAYVPPTRVSREFDSNGVAFTVGASAEGEHHLSTSHPTSDESTSHPSAGAAGGSAPIRHNHVYIDENGRRVVQRYTDPQADHPTPTSHTYLDPAYAHLTTLPPVTINPQTGLPNPVYSPDHGMNLYIPSELSWANNVPLSSQANEFDRGFRQTPTSSTILTTMTHHLHHLSQPLVRHTRPASPALQSQHQSYATSQPNNGYKSTLGQKVQVAFEWSDDNEQQTSNTNNDTNDDDSNAAPAGDEEQHATHPIRSYGGRPASPFRPATPTHRLGDSASRSTPPPALLRVPTVVRAHAAALAQLAQPVDAITPRPASRNSAAPESTSVIAPNGTRFETVYADGELVDTSVAPTYSVEHGMHLYNPNHVSWSGGVAPLDRAGLRTPLVGSSLVVDDVIRHGRTPPTHDRPNVWRTNGPVKAVHGEMTPSPRQAKTPTTPTMTMTPNQMRTPAQQNNSNPVDDQRSPPSNQRRENGGDIADTPSPIRAPKFTRKPSGEVPRVLGSHHAHHPSLDSSVGVVDVAAPSTPRVSTPTGRRHLTPISPRTASPRVPTVLTPTPIEHRRPHTPRSNNDGEEMMPNRNTLTPRPPSQARNRTPTSADNAAAATSATPSDTPPARKVYPKAVRMDF